VIRCLPGGVTWAIFPPPFLGKGASLCRRRGASCRRRGVCGPAVPPFGFRAVPYLESDSKLAPNLLVLGLNNICCFHTRSARFKKHQNQQRLGFRPGPHWRAYSAPPGPLAGGEGDSYPSPRTPPRLGPSGLRLQPFGPRSSVLQFSTQIDVTGQDQLEC